MTLNYDNYSQTIKEKCSCILRRHDRCALIVQQTGTSYQHTDPLIADWAKPLIQQSHILAIHFRNCATVHRAVYRTDRHAATTTKRIEQNLIVRSGKSEAKVINNRRLRSTYCTTERNYWQTLSIAQPLCDSRATCSMIPYDYRVTK